MQVTKAELLKRINDGWDKFQAYIATLKPEQLTEPTDEAGWTGKDHLIHIAVWEDGIDALLNKQIRHQRMGLADGVWGNTHVDVINAQIQEQHKEKSLETIEAERLASHHRLIQTIESLSDEDLNRPYKYYAADSDAEDPVWGWIVGNTFEHYAEHQPWIAEIAAKVR